MIYSIRYWYGLPPNHQHKFTSFKHQFTYLKEVGTKKKPKREAVTFEGEAVEIPDDFEAMKKFITKVGAVVINRQPSYPFWRILVSDETGTFGQK